MTETQQSYHPQPAPPAVYQPQQPGYQLNPPPMQEKSKRNVLGIIALILSAVGFIFACVPGALILGWILLPIGFILGIIAVCLRGKVKWQGVTAIVVSAVGTIVGFVVFFALAAAAVGAAVGGPDVTVGGDTQVAAPQEGAAAEADAPSGTRENPLAFNTPISTDDWDVTLTALNPNGNEVVAAGNQFNEAPGAGQQYVILDLGATYKGTDEGLSSMVQVDYVAADGTVISSWDSLVAGVEPTFGQASMYAGAADNGKIVFLVPSSLDGLIRVQPGMFADEMFFTLP